MIKNTHPICHPLLASVTGGLNEESMLLFWPSAPALLATSRTNNKFWTCLFAIAVLRNFSSFCSASLEIIGVKVYNRQTDRQIHSHIELGSVQLIQILIFFKIPIYCCELAHFSVILKEKFTF